MTQLVKVTTPTTETTTTTTKTTTHTTTKITTQISAINDLIWTKFYSYVSISTTTTLITTTTKLKQLQQQQQYKIIIDPISKKVSYYSVCIGISYGKLF